MNEQTSFVEPLKRVRRVKTKPTKLAEKLAEKLTTLADWYKTNKPSVKILRITKDDAWSLREAWLENQIECRKNGFSCMISTPKTVTAMSFRGFDLVETA